MGVGGMDDMDRRTLTNGLANGVDKVECDCKAASTLPEK